MKQKQRTGWKVEDCKLMTDLIVARSDADVVLLVRVIVFGESPVYYSDLLFGWIEHYVLRFQVTVHHAVIVCVDQCF